ncbi:MAG: ABC transporter permease [Armatimonadetes bacterium]|nr:ABC transporter permease [Armatimonadota bacterium]
MTRLLPLLRRLFWALATLLGTSVIVFGMARSVPADPIAAFVGQHADAATRERIRRELGLDDPVWQQYLRYVGNAARGDLGRSFVTGEAVSAAIRSRFPVTAGLAAGAVLIWIGLGTPLGILTARRRGSGLDRSVLLLSMIGISLPTFWLGRLLQFQFAYRWAFFPVAGYADWRHLVLPSVTLGLVGAGYYARLVHTHLLEVLGQDFVRAARARGLAERWVLLRHALPNALAPVLTVLGADIASVLGGVVFTESIFALPGIGTLTVQAVLNLDVPMLMGTVLFSAALVVAANLVVDLLYGWLDPRVRGE